MTTTATLTLAEFLLSRIAEDEAAAKNAQGRDEYGEERTFYESFSVGRDDWGVSFFTVDPARVLAECETKRRIVEQYGEHPQPNVYLVLADLAAVYSDHPDYRPDWRP